MKDMLVLLCIAVLSTEGAASDPCPLGGSYCPDGRTCQGGVCVWPQGTTIHNCMSRGEDCAAGRKCIPCYLRSGELCCRRDNLLGNDPYCGVEYMDNNTLVRGSFCPDGKVCQEVSGQYSCAFTTPQPSCSSFGQICGLSNDRNCVQCYFLSSGFCCRRRSKLGSIASECQYGGTSCPAQQTCQQTTGTNGVVIRTCV